MRSSSFTLQHRSTASLSENKKILEPFETSPKIQTIVDQISQLSLLEVAELNQALKTQLKIPDAPVMYAGAAVAAEKTQVCFIDYDQLFYIIQNYFFWYRKKMINLPNRFKPHSL